jgi:protocatechuate 3,4-dioxygenase beta subunit
MYIFFRRIAISLAVALLLVLFALRVSAGKQQSTPSSSDDDKQTASVEGTVVRAGTDEPLRKAQVILSRRDNKDGNSRVTVTGTDGKFMFKGVAPGSYDLYVDHDGYVARSYGEDSEGKGAAILTLLAAQKMRDLIFRLQKCGVISGHVVDEDGDPMPGIPVEAVQRTTRRGKVSESRRFVFHTNDLGEYRLFDLPPGQYCVRAIPDYMRRIRPSADDLGNVETGTKAATDYAPTYYPNATDISRASTVQLKSGDDFSSMDIVLVRSRTYKIRGHITDLTEGSIGGQYSLVVFSEDQQPVNVQGIVHPKSRDFEISGIPPGKFTVFANRSNETGPFQGLAEVQVIDADLGSVNIVIKRRSDVRGRVAMEDKVVLPKYLRIFLRSTESDFSTSGGLPQARVKQDGTFDLENVGDGVYEVDASSECDECYLKSAKMNGLDLLEKGLQVSGQGSQPVELLYSSRSGTVDGVVAKSDELPAVGAKVLLVPDPPYRERRALYRNATADQYGRFTIRGVAPGKYKAFAFATDPGFDDFTDPEFMRPLESKGESVSVEENGKQTLRLKLIEIDSDSPSK